MSARPTSLRWPGGVVSFTFDDFPKSALSIGGAILERRGFRGTYYTAMTLAGADHDNLGPMFDIQDVVSAHSTGHEIACHTYTHLRCRNVTKSLIETEITNNAAALRAVLEGFTPESFAYPYGAVSVKGKQLLGGHFSSCRGISRGINDDIVDLADLLSVMLYAESFDEREICQLIERNRARDGWLIFLTHDVAERPSPYGCTPQQLETVLAYAAARATVLPVRSVTARIRAAQREPRPLNIAHVRAFLKVYGGRHRWLD
jgi:peptidoglycan/xylan/chitin deacetylase (PgdA/CDA1 family)